MGIQVKDLPLLETTPETATILGVHNGSPVRIPKNKLSSGDPISVNTVKGLTSYQVTAPVGTYMKAIKETIEAEGGDISRLNLVTFDSLDNVLLIKMKLADNQNYHINCIDLHYSQSFTGSVDINTQLIHSFVENQIDLREFSDDILDIYHKLDLTAKGYSFEVPEPSTTVFDLITHLRDAGYRPGDPLTITLRGSISGSYIGYIDLSADESIYSCELNKIGTSEFYSSSGTNPRTATLYYLLESGSALTNTSFSTVELWELVFKNIANKNHSIYAHDDGSLQFSIDGNTGSTGQVLIHDGEGIKWGDVPTGESTGESTFRSITVTNNGNDTLSVIIDKMTEKDIPNSVWFILNLNGVFSGTYFCKVQAYGGSTRDIILVDLSTFSRYSVVGNHTTITISDLMKKCISPYSPSKMIPTISLALDKSTSWNDVINLKASAGLSNLRFLVKITGEVKMTAFADVSRTDNVCSYCITDLLTLSIYQGTANSTDKVYEALQTSSNPSSSSSGVIDIEEFPTGPDTSAIYRKWQVTKAVWLYNGEIVTDGGMTCEVVTILPETGNMCYTGTAMYSYYQRADGEVYGYVNDILSQQMSVPMGWYPASTLFAALGYTYNGIINSMDNASSEGYQVLITKKPHLYSYHNNGTEVEKSAIITNNNYEFDEATGTLTQIIIL